MIGGGKDDPEHLQNLKDFHQCFAKQAWSVWKTNETGTAQATLEETQSYIFFGEIKVVIWNLYLQYLEENSGYDEQKGESGQQVLRSNPQT